MKHIIRRIALFFFPHERNGYRACSLHLDSLSLYLLFAVVLVFAVKKTPLGTQVLGVATDISVQRLFELTNQQREAHGQSKLSYNETLAQAAKKKAEDMFSNNYWAHYSPAGRAPWDFIIESGYSYEYAGENLAKNFLFSQNVIDAWMNSPTHRDNLLKAQYAEVGYAVVNGVLNGEETTLVVQMFGTPTLIASQQQEVAQKEKIARTQVPQKTLTVVQSQPVQDTSPNTVLGKQNVQKPSRASIAFNINLAFMFFLMTAVFADLLIAAKLKLIPLHGKHIAHLLFLAFILMGVVLILRQGAII